MALSKTVVCKICEQQKERNRENFYYNNRGAINGKICKPCYKKQEAIRVVQGRKQKVNVMEKLRQITLSKANTRTFPKGHPMNPIRQPFIAEPVRPITR